MSGYGETNVSPPSSKYSSEFFSPSYIKLAHINPNQDFNEKFQLDRKIFLSWKIKKQMMRGIRTHDLTRSSFKSYPLDQKRL